MKIAARIFAVFIIVVAWAYGIISSLFLVLMVFKKYYIIQTLQSEARVYFTQLQIKQLTGRLYMYAFIMLALSILLGWAGSAIIKKSRNASSH